MAGLFLSLESTSGKLGIAAVTGLASAGRLGTSPAPVVALGPVKPLCRWGWFGGWGVRKGERRLRGQRQQLGEKHWNRGDDWE